MGETLFYFLACLRRKKLMGKLRKFVKRGGILSGESAGAIIQTPNIGLAGYPKFDCDDNEVRLKNMSALKLVPFEFFPHYSGSKRYVEAFQAYTKRKKQHLYAVKDGSAIVVDGKNLYLLGDITCFFKGKKLP